MKKLIQNIVNKNFSVLMIINPANDKIFQNKKQSY